MTLTLQPINYYNAYLQQQTQVNTDEILDEYLGNLQVMRATKKSYTACLKKYFDYLDNNNITKVDLKVLISYVEYLREHTEIIDGKLSVVSLKPKTINTHITALKSFYNFLETKDLKNYAKFLKKENINESFAKQPLTFEQVDRIASNIDTSNIEGARAYAIFMLMVGTGLRECEITRANIGDMKTIGNSIVLYVQGKGRKEKSEYVELKPSVLNPLQEYLKFRPNAKDNEPLITGIGNKNINGRLTTMTLQRIVKDLFAKNGIVGESYTTHSLRHTAITLAILSGASLQQAQAMARHKNCHTTEIYFHNLERLSDSNAESKLNDLYSNLSRNKQQG